MRVPGDKSISHRALILGALTVGETRITGLLEGEDVINTATPCGRWARPWSAPGRAPGASMGWASAGFAEPAAPLDFGNSGTGCRLRHGGGRGLPDHRDLRRRCLAAHAADAARARSAGAHGRACGERRRRRAAAADAAGRARPDPDRLRAAGRVRAAQVRRAAGGALRRRARPWSRREATRDHTERMLRHFGAEVAVEPNGAHGRRITLKGQPELVPAPVVVPADPSSAAFPLVAALIVPGSEIVLEGVMTNVTRTGLFTTLREMGADIEELDARLEGGEDVADLRVRASALKGVDVPPERAPFMIDEYLVLGVAAAFAEGTTRMRGLKELRVKESDRLAATAAMLRVNGVEVEIEGDDLIVHGKGRGGGRRPRRDPHGPPHRDVGAGDGPCEREARAGRRLRVHRDELPGLRRDDARARARS